MRQLGCRDCERITSGDCGKHGPIFIPVSRSLPGSQSLPIRPEQNDFAERLAKKWLDEGCPHIAPEWELDERCCFKAAVREALEGAGDALACDDERPCMTGLKESGGPNELCRTHAVIAALRGAPGVRGVGHGDEGLE